jgi:peptide/nickel transport system permease protein
MLSRYTKEGAVIHRLMSIRWSDVVGAVLFVLICGAATVGPLIYPVDPYELHAEDRLSPPNSEYPFGTDRLGRDMLSRVIFGLRTSLTVAVGAVLFATVVGLPLGMLSGYFGGHLDNIIMRLMDMIFSFPPILLAIAISAVRGPGIPNAIIAIGIVYIPRMVRISRGPVLAIRQMEYVEAAIAVGSPPLRNMLRHILPNIAGPVLVFFTLSLAVAILAEAALSFVGLGAQPPVPSLGWMVDGGRLMMHLAPWLSIFPGITIVAAVVSFNLLGDTLRDQLDPKTRTML